MCEDVVTFAGAYQISGVALQDWMLMAVALLVLAVMQKMRLKCVAVCWM
jgi:hypothetical protein